MRRVLKISGITILAFLLILILFPFIFKSKVQQEVKNLANRNLKSELNFSGMSLSFFRHFPNLTFTLTDFQLNGSPPFEKDTLIHADEISLGINVASLFGKTIKVTRIYFEQAEINILFNEKGIPNYNVYEPEKTVAESDTSDVPANLKIEQIYLKNCRIIYADPSINAKVVA